MPQPKHFAVGDIQGCYDPLRTLLDLAHFDPTNDILWVAGDMVNRGPHNVEVLRFLSSLGEHCVAVLGNHDLHLLAAAQDHRHIKPSDTLQDVLQAPDADYLLGWLRHRPLLHYNANLNYVMTHAGIPPQWSLPDAIDYAREIEQRLRSIYHADFLMHLYGNQPTQLTPQLSNTERKRIITNYFTRMRFCSPTGELDFSLKTQSHNAPTGMAPWYSYPHRLLPHIKLLFGHWAALQGITHHPHAIALDTGCVWGGCLTLKRLTQPQHTFQVRCAHE